MKELRKDNKCLNCKAEIGQSNYCPECGQQNTDNKVSMMLLVKDFVHDYLDIDSKLFKSIPLLITKPGKLTREFTGGKRVRFVPPLRLYLVVSLIFFLIPSNDSGEEPEADPVSDLIEEHDTKAPDTTESSFNITTNIVDKGINIEFEGFDSLKSKNDFNIEEIDSIVGAWLDKNGVKTGTFWHNSITRVVHRSLGIIQEEESSLEEAFHENLPPMMFFLLPLFALILKMMFFSSGKLYIEHVIFALHFHSFTFLSLIVDHLFELAGINITGWFYLLILVYLFLAARNVYQESKSAITLKLIGLGFLYWVAIILAAAITLILTVFFY
ncbi:DUF3667 domain-containing protein [bacterium AH-315-C07]|nr:DUF3667 domain-containing protein [bacterium AH-315-C07]